MIFIGVGDLHIQSRYHCRLDNVIKTFEDKFQQIGLLKYETKAEAVLCTGDIFNNKNPKNISHGLVNWTIKQFQQLNAYSIIGNHDVQYNDLRRISRQPLGVLFNSGALHELYAYPGTAFEENDGYVNVWGFDYGTNIIKSSDMVPNNTILVTHCYMAKQPGTFYGTERVWGFDEFEHLGVDFILNGHDHTPYPIEKHKNTLIVRPGALFRTTVGEADLKREVKVAIIDTVEKKAEYVTLKHEPAKKIFDLKSKETIQKTNTELTTFVKDLQNLNVAKKKSIGEALVELCEDTQVYKKITEYLDEVKK